MKHFINLLLKAFQDIDSVSEEEINQLILISSNEPTFTKEDVRYLLENLKNITYIPHHSDGIVDNLIRVIEDLDDLSFIFEIGVVKMNSLNWFDLYEYAYKDLNQFMASNRLPNFSPRDNIHKYLSEIKTTELTTQELEFLAFVLYCESPGDLDTDLALAVIRSQKSYGDFIELKKLSSLDFLEDI